MVRKAVAGEDFRDQRVGQPAPSGEYRFAGVQVGGKREGRNRHLRSPPGLDVGDGFRH